MSRQTLGAYLKLSPEIYGKQNSVAKGSKNAKNPYVEEKILLKVEIMKFFHLVRMLNNYFCFFFYI